MISVKTVLYKSYVAIYSTIGAVVLYCMIGGILAYGFTMGFYSFNTLWIAPIVASPSEDRILSLTQQLIESQTVLNTLIIDEEKMSKGLGELQMERMQSRSLTLKLNTAIDNTTHQDEQNGTDLTHLAYQKHNDIQISTEVTKQMNLVRETIKKDLSAGLITQGEAAIQTAELTSNSNALTDSQIQETLLRDNITQKLTVDISKVSVLSQREQLRQQSAQLDLAIELTKKQDDLDLKQIAQITRAIALAKRTPYYRASIANDNITLAFVPYDNARNAREGQIVYDCYLSMVACRKVGTISFVFSDEEHALNPLLKTDMRGFLIQLDMTDVKASRSKTLFLKRKPLFF